MYNKKSKFIIALSAVAVLVLLLGITLGLDGNQRYNGPSSDITTGPCRLELNRFDDEVYLVNDVVVEWMNSEKSAQSLYDAFRSEGKLDLPMSVTVSYTVSNLPLGVSVTAQTVEVAENEQFDNATVHTVAAHKRRLDIFNLKVNTQYYYRVTVNLSDGRRLVETDSFKTAQSPRFIYVDGVRNVRDIGGYKTVDGKTIRQGLFYRGTEADGAGSKKYFITEAGVDTFVNELGIVTELDLRSSTFEGVKDTLGDTVKHSYHSYLAYMDTFTEHGNKKNKELFSILAKEETYPVYLHCSYGADRTGTFCYLLGALLGMSEEDLHREWELSIFFAGGAFEEDMEKFLAHLSTFKGDTIQQKVENYLLSIGVTKSEINSIRNKFLYTE